MSNELHVFTDDEEFVIAVSAEDAVAIMRDIGADADRIDWRQMWDDQPLIADLDDGNGSVKKTCGEWAAERGRGYFCASDD